MEVANVLVMGERRKRITVEQSAAFLFMLAMSDIRVESILPAGELSELLSLTRRYGLTAYDAAYLGLAKRRRLPLATFDKDLIRAAPLEGVELVGRPV